MKFDKINELAGIASDIARMARQLAERLNNAEPFSPGPEERAAFLFNTSADSRAVRTRATRPPLPDPRLVRRIVRHRQLRARFFAADLFADPAWDMLLDLTAARAEHARVSVSSLCIASGVPPTTALRWIGILVDADLAERVEDDVDRRRVFVSLSDRGAAVVARYFAAMGGTAAPVI